MASTLGNEPDSTDKADLATGPRPGDLLAGKYRVDRLLGHGGMAVVYAGQNVLTGKRVALKLLRQSIADMPEAVARFEREALTAGRIHHPAVVTVFDIVTHKNAACLVMELLDGEPLASMLERRTKLPPDEAVRLLLPALRGLGAAHAAGVVHRDLKPENIFLCRNELGGSPITKVLDFGVSKLMNENPVGITMAGTLVGTPKYMAPEQVRGGGSDHKSDIYSFGVLLYQVLSGQCPYNGDVYSAIMVDIATKNPPPLEKLAPDVPASLRRIVSRAMARDPGDRFESAEEMAGALEAWLRGDVTTAARPSPFSMAAVPGDATAAAARPKPLAKWAAAGLMALGVAGGIAWVVHRHSQGPLDVPRAARAVEAGGAQLRPGEEPSEAPSEAAARRPEAADGTAAAHGTPQEPAGLKAAASAAGLTAGDAPRAEAGEAEANPSSKSPAVAGRTPVREEAKGPAARRRPARGPAPRAADMPDLPVPGAAAASPSGSTATAPSGAPPRAPRSGRLSIDDF